MSANDYLQVAVFLLVLIFLTPILGNYLSAVLDNDNHPLQKPFHWLENLIYKLCKIDKTQSYDWKRYCMQLLAFNALGFFVLFTMEILQAQLPFNPNHLANLRWDLAFNTAISFMTNTNWQSYAGETTISYLTAIFGLTLQNFLSAATGITVILALIRGIRNKSITTIGNFWVDLTRSIVYVLLPMSVILAVFLVTQGVVQNLSTNTPAYTIEGSTQVLPMGPAASQIAIKQLGTNGGGYFNTNSAHPFENPSPLSNFAEMLAILLLPSALVYMCGIMLRSRRQGIIILSVMFSIFLTGLALALWSEFSVNNIANVMEGKELRFGIVNSVLWANATTTASSGSVNAMHSSLSPLAGGIAMFNIMLGEIIFGGVGAGLYGMFMFIFLTVFLAGLMVGRTPEFMGKKIEAKEMIYVMIALLTPNLLILIGSAISVLIPQGLSSILNPGPHGLSEILYAFSSASGNNGSAFAGLNANTPYYNIALGLCMLISRFACIIPALAIAGSLSNKKITPESSGTFPTDSILFAILLIGVILIVGGLTFMPALVIGPVAEHLLMLEGRLF